MSRHFESTWRRHPGFCFRLSTPHFRLHNNIPVKICGKTQINGFSLAYFVLKPIFVIEKFISTELSCVLDEKGVCFIAYDYGPGFL